jgi:hypothetical protein
MTSEGRKGRMGGIGRMVRENHALIATVASGFSRTFIVCVIVLQAALLAQSQLPTAIPQTKFASGQDIQPYFEGWIRNADGSFDMVFGYFNRNWQEELAIPAGADNMVEPFDSAQGRPGGPDRGQPTYFLPRRQGWVYRVRVPKDFGKQVVTWTIKASGRTQKAYGELLPVEEITERIVMTRGNLNPGDDDPNKPPVVSIAPVEGAAARAAVSIAARVTDDGLPTPRVVVARPKTIASDGTTIQAQANSNAAPRPRGLTVSWMQLRGPAKAALEPGGAQPVADGKATITARFAQPGIYVLRATANDGALSTKTDITVNVTGPSSDARR